MPTLTLFCGLPGSGKTTLAHRLQAQGRGVRICTDQWQSWLGIGHDDVAFHERLQPVLYRHAMELVEHGVSVILEDGLWTKAERAEKFSDARARGARIDFHVFDVPLETLWARLQGRNDEGDVAEYPMTKDELTWAWGVFEPPSPEELALVDTYQIHGGGLD